MDKFQLAKPPWLKTPQYCIFGLRERLGNLKLTDWCGLLSISQSLGPGLTDRFNYIHGMLDYSYYKVNCN